MKLQAAPTAQTNEFAEVMRGAVLPLTMKRRPESSAYCPSGLITLTDLLPGVEPIVETVTVNCVGETYVTPVTVTPGISTLRRLAKPGPESKKPEPPADVPVSVKVVLGVLAGMDAKE